MDLQEIRAQIDMLDDKLLECFLKRMDLSDQVARYKGEHALPVENKLREREILKAVTEKAGERESYAHRFFTLLFEMSKARQRELINRPSGLRQLLEAALSSGASGFPRSASVACQGTEGANSQAACDKLVPHGSIVYFKTFEAVFDAVGSGLCKYGVLPVENSSNGSVRAVYELLQHRGFPIVRSTRLCIRHELLAKQGTELKDIKAIYSHQQALDQCGRFLSGLTGVRIIPCANTAVAAQMVAESDDPNVAAIASHACAELYGLKVVDDNIQDSDNNYTRFVCIARQPVIYPGANRISLALSCDNKPGALYNALSGINALGINMSKLESCPVSGRSFEFVFFLDLEASVTEPGVIPMLEELERSTDNFCFLGSYSEI